MQKFTLIIGNKNYSSWSLRAWLALKQTGAEFEEILISLYRSDHQAKIKNFSSAGKVPILKHGDLVVWDSLAIGEYLADFFPEAGLLPQNLEARAQMRSVIAEMHSGFMALRSHLPMNCRRHAPFALPAEPKLREEIARVDEIWSRCIQKYNGPFLFGDFTLADAFYAPVAIRFYGYQVSLSKSAQQYQDSILSFPTVKEWVEAGKAESLRLEEFERN